jgi:hypothetical protein
MENFGRQRPKSAPARGAVSRAYLNALPGRPMARHRAGGTSLPTPWMAEADDADIGAMRKLYDRRLFSRACGRAAMPPGRINPTKIVLNSIFMRHMIVATGLISGSTQPKGENEWAPIWRVY